MDTGILRNLLNSVNSKEFEELLLAIKYIESSKENLEYIVDTLISINKSFPGTYIPYGLARDKAKDLYNFHIREDEDLWEGSTCAECGENEIKDGKFITEHAKDCPNV